MWAKLHSFIYSLMYLYLVEGGERGGGGATVWIVGL